MSSSEHEFNNDDLGATSESTSDDAATMPLGIGDMNDSDFGDFTSEKPKLKLNSGVLLIVATVLIAAIGLFSMRTLTRVSAATEEPQQIAQSIDEFLDIYAKGGDTQASRTGVVDVLNESYATRQVPLDDVQRNPFIIFEEKAAEVPQAQPVDPLVAQRRARQTQFESAASGLRVGMVLTGSQPMANVNGRVVRIGDTVLVGSDVLFRVVDIAADRVDFLAEDEALGVRVEKSVSLRHE